MTEPERAYYERRAPEYDDFYLGTGLYAQRSRPGWGEELDQLRSVLSRLAFSSVLDVACGTGFLSRWLPGRVVGIDQSPSMLKIAQSRIPGGVVLQGDAMQLPFEAQQFDCVSAGHFYGHLLEPDRIRFLEEARRVARRILIVDAALRDEVLPAQTQDRILNDGSKHSVYKRYFDPGLLLDELDGGVILHAGRWFIAALS